MSIFNREITFQREQLWQLQKIEATRYFEGRSGKIHIINFSKKLSGFERTGVFILALASTASTLGLGLLSSDIRGLWRQSLFGERQIKAKIIENDQFSIQIHGILEDGTPFFEFKSGIEEQIEKNPPPIPVKKPLNSKDENRVQVEENKIQTAQVKEISGERYHEAYCELEKQFPKVSFEPLDQSEKELQNLTPIGIPNFLGYNCYLSTVCQRLARISSYNAMLNVELTERHTEIDVRLQLLLRGVVSELRNNRMPERNLILALHKTLVSEPGFQATGQQDATEIFLLLSRVMNVPIDEVQGQEAFYYETQQKDVSHPKIESKKLINEWGFEVTHACYSGGYEENSNFSNVFDAFPNQKKKARTITDLRAKKERAYLSLKQGTEGLSVSEGLKTTALHFDRGVVDSEKKGTSITNSRADRMRVLRLQDGVVINSYDHKDWKRKGFADMTASQLKSCLKVGEEFVVCEKKGRRSQYLEPPPQIEVAYKSGSKSLLQEDFSLSMKEYVSGECPDYELVDIIWTSSSQRKNFEETSGHYIYFHKQGEKWFKYNDSVVTEQTQEEVIQSMKGKGYSLLYQPVEKS